MTAGTVILASAGTGKTHRLSGRFIECLATHADPAGILAATFTRSAAGEIMDRVLKRLALASRGVPHAWPDTLADEPDPRARAALLLRDGVRQIHRWRVSTIDGVLGSLARMLATELDLAPGWSIVDEATDRELRAEAITRALERAEIAELVPLIRMLHEGGPGRSVHGAITKAVDGAYGAYLDSAGAPGVWETIQPDGEPMDGNARALLLGRLRALAVPRTKAGTPRKSWEKALASVGAALEANNTKALLGARLVQAASEEPPRFDRADLSDEYIGVLMPIGAHAAAAEIGALRDRNRSTHSLIARFDREYAGLKRRHGLVTFADVPRLLLGSAYHGRLDHLYYRLDARVTHVLLDEFQDTSREQYDLLEPLIEEICAEDGAAARSVLVVGDVKQSLYGWRGASPDVLPALPERWATLERSTLSTSYRSSPVVIDAVNRVFRQIPASPALSEHAEAAASWAREFVVHTSARAQLRGSVTLLESSAEDGARDVPEAGPDADADVGHDPEPTEKPQFTAAAEAVASLTADPSVETIGVLVRRNATVAPVMRTLAAAGVTASERTGRPLTDAHAVRALLAALRAAEHPGDTAAHLAASTSRFAGIFGYSGPTWRRDQSDANRVGRRLRARFHSGGGAGLVGWFLASVRDRIGPVDRHRLHALHRAATDWDAGPGRRGAGPAEFVDAALRARAVDDNASRVRVMTVHASKGLEFDAVVLPELDTSWSLRPDELLVDRPDPFGPARAVSEAGREALRQVHPELRALRESTQARKIGEELSVLYVAMTRAARRLVLVVPAEGGRSIGCTSAAILRAALDQPEPSPPDPDRPEGQTPSVPARPVQPWPLRESTRVLFHHESADESTDEPPVKVGDTREDAPSDTGAQSDLPSPVTIRVARGASVTPAWALARRVPSADRTGETIAAGHPRPVPAAPDADPVAVGLALHAAIEQIDWLDRDAPASGSASLWKRLLPAASDACDGDPAALARCESVLLGALRSDDIVDLLTAGGDRTPPGLGLRVLNEFPIAARVRTESEAEELVIGRIDRLVLTVEGAGAVRAAEVIDFKAADWDRARTDVSSAVAGARAVYSPQIRAYQRAVSATFGLGPGSVRGTLVLLGIGRVVEYDPV